MTKVFTEKKREFIVDIKDEDYDLMMPYYMNLIVDGLPPERIDEHSFIIKYSGYSIVNTTEKTIRAAIKRTDDI